MATTEYATLAEARGRVGIEASDPSEDGRLEPALIAASRYIDGWCGRSFWQRDSATAREFAPTNDSLLDLEGWDISTTTGLIVAIDTGDDGTYETTLTRGTHYQVEPLGGYAPTGETWPYTHLRILQRGGQWWPCTYDRPTVQVTARWGWPEVPRPVKEACLMLAHDIWKMKDVAIGVGGGDFLGTFTPQTNRMAEALLVPYRHGLVMTGFA